MPENLKELISQCLDPLPESRPHDFSEVIDKLCSLYQLLTGEEFPRTDTERLNDTAGALNNRALSYLDLGKPEKADELLERALTTKTAHMDALFNRSLFHLRTGEIYLHEAKKQLKPIEDTVLLKLMESELDKENSGKLELVLDEYASHLPDGAIAVSRDGSRILTAEKPIKEKIGDFIKKKKDSSVRGNQIRYCVRRVGDDCLLFRHNAEKKVDVHMSTDGNYMIILGEKYTEAYAVDTKSMIFRYEGKCSLSPDGKYIVGYLPMDSWSRQISTEPKRKPFIYRVEKQTKLCFTNRNLFITFTENGKILFRDRNGDYRLQDPEADVQNEDVFIRDSWEKMSSRRNSLEEGKFCLQCIGGEKGARYFLEQTNYNDLYDLTTEKKILRLPIRFRNTVHASLLNNEEYLLTISKVYKDHYDTDDGKSYLTFAVWELATGQLVYETQPDLMYQDRRRFYFYNYVKDDCFTKLIAGGTYTPGKKTDYRLTSIESINARRLAAKNYRHFMEEASTAYRQDNTLLAVEYVRKAMKESGYENSEEALKLLSEYGKKLEKTGCCRLVPLSTPVSKTDEKPVHEKYGPGIEAILQEKIKNQVARFEKKFKDNNREDYSAYCWEDGVYYSENGKYLTIITITDEHYYNMSPEVNDPDPEDSYARGFLLFNAESEKLVFENMDVTWEPWPEYPDFNPKRYYNDKFRAIPDNQGKRVLVIDLEDNLLLQKPDWPVPEKLMQEDCLCAEFFDDGRYILTLHKGGDAEVFNVEDKPFSCGKVHLEGCDKVFVIDNNRFGYGDSIRKLCMIEWE